MAPRLALLLVALVVSGCGTDEPLATSIPQPSLEQPTAALSTADLAEAVRFRTSYGLRADEPWILQVARADVSNTERYGTPLTPQEMADLDARARNADAVEEAIHAYGVEQPDWAGMYIDQLDRGRVVALFTSRVELHRTRLGALVNPLAVWDVRLAQWSLAELESFQDRVTAEEAWMSDIGVGFVSSSVRVSENRVRLMIDSADPEAPERIITHLSGQDWLKVDSTGVAPWSGPRGNLVVVVLGVDGSPVVGAECVPEPDITGAFTSDDTAIGTDSAGECRIHGIGATWTDVRIFDVVHGRREVGVARALVPPGGTVHVEVVVPLP